MYVDIGASLLIAAEKAEIKIAVELKSFKGYSPMNDLENAVGQYIVYNDVLEKIDPDRVLYLAVDLDTFDGIFSEPIGKLILDNDRLNIIVFDRNEEVIVECIPPLNINN